ncbi:hypothetical protein TRIUR3_34715 [Triticum urartu]|uniref:Uncharacterized protein n=1 Tax=Triticum urartu TaxID=4572 RepID=M7ZJM2_TRIUA|nr:hypothetical protein TRIUR3_34715 [Triticum urartu]
MLLHAARGCCPPPSPSLLPLPLPIVPAYTLQSARIPMAGSGRGLILAGGIRSFLLSGQTSMEETTTATMVVAAQVDDGAPMPPWIWSRPIWCLHSLPSLEREGEGAWRWRKRMPPVLVGGGGHRQRDWVRGERRGGGNRRRMWSVFADSWGGGGAEIMGRGIRFRRGDGGFQAC